MALISTSNSFNDTGSILVNGSFSFKTFMILGMIFGSISITLHFKSFNYGIISYFKNTNFISIVIFFLILVLMISMYVSKYTMVSIAYLFIDMIFLVVSFITTTGLIPEYLADLNFLIDFYFF